MRVVSGRVMAGVVAGLLGLGACVPAYAGSDGGWVLSSTGAPVDVSGVPACESEDQLAGPCFWDATVAGDGAGDSFLVEEDGSVSYVEPAPTGSSVSMQGVHSASPSAAVDKPVSVAASPSGSAVVDSVDSGVRDNYDREVLVVSAVFAAVGILVAPLVMRRADGRRVRR